MCVKYTLPILYIKSVSLSAAEDSYKYTGRIRTFFEMIDSLLVIDLMCLSVIRIYIDVIYYDVVPERQLSLL